LAAHPRDDRSSPIASYQSEEASHTTQDEERLDLTTTILTRRSSPDTDATVFASSERQLMYSTAFVGVIIGAWDWLQTLHLPILHAPVESEVVVRLDAGTTN